MTHRTRSIALTSAGVVLSAVTLLAGAASFESKARADGKSDKAGNTDKIITTAEQPAAHLSSSGRALADELSLAFEQAASAVAPSVVAVVSEKSITRMTQSQRGGSPFDDSPFGDLLRRFGVPDQQPAPRGDAPEGLQARGVGSGVIVRADGYVLTNNHVVEGASRVTVVLDDDRELDAQVIGTDPETDLAVIKVDARDLPAARLGDSSAARVGQWVIAVGNPFELRHTVTAGIISATGRSTVGLATYEDFIQTDASINPGNSGGALADLDGRVIGINTAISSPSGGNVGIGFAIPIDMAERVMADLIKDGSISRGYLALMPQDIEPDLAKALHLEGTKGALVADVTAGGPASKAGIETGDVIVAFAGQAVSDSKDLRNQVASAEPGSKVEVDLLRDGHKKTMSVSLGTRPGAQVASNERTPSGEPDRLSRFGFEATELTPDIAAEIGSEGQQGVVVSQVDPAGPAARAGLRRGDLIQRVGRDEVTTVGALRSSLAAASDEDVALLVRRGPGSLYLVLKPSEPAHGR